MAKKNRYEELADKLPLPTLEGSWLHGWRAFPFLGRALVRPLVHARQVLEQREIDESRAREIRAELERVFVEWRNTHGKKPPTTRAGSKSGLLGPPLSHVYYRKRLTDIPPYHCAGPSVSDYTELFVQLRGSGYKPLARFLARVGTKTALAVLVLSEAARGNGEEALLAREHLLEAEQQEKAALWRDLGRAKGNLEAEIRLRPIREQAKALEQGRREGGKASGATRKEFAEKAKAQALEMARKLRDQSGKERHEIAGILAPKVDRSARWVRDTLKAAGFYEERKGR